MLKIGQKAPEFTATAVIDQEFKVVKLSDYLGKYVVLFFIPLILPLFVPQKLLLLVNVTKNLAV